MKGPLYVRLVLEKFDEWTKNAGKMPGEYVSERVGFISFHLVMFCE